jgi:hypothetical protein
MQTSSSDDLIGHRLGDYVIDGVLAVGGMATVYLYALGVVLYELLTGRIMAGRSSSPGSG